MWKCFTNIGTSRYKLIPNIYVVVIKLELEIKTKLIIIKKYSANLIFDLVC